VNIQQNAASNILLLKSLEKQSKAEGGTNEKTLPVEIKSVLQNKNAILVALPSHSSVLLEIPLDAAIKASFFSAGDKIEIPVSAIRTAVNLQLQEMAARENPQPAPSDKFASNPQPTNDKAAEFTKIAEAVLRNLSAGVIEENAPKTIEETKIAAEKIIFEKKDSIPKPEREFVKTILREIEQIIRRLPSDSALVQSLPKAESIKNLDDILNWAGNQIKSGNLPARDFIALPQILFSSAAVQNHGRIISAPTAVSDNSVGADIIRPHPEGAGSRATTITQPPHLEGTESRATTNQTVAPQVPPQFVQQTKTNIIENIQNLIPQFKNESIKSVLNEIIRQISADSSNQNAFAFVKMNVKSQDTASFLPLNQQAQFNSEFTAIMEKKFPNLPKELFTETANIIKNSEKPLVLSETVLKTVENISHAGI